MVASCLIRRNRLHGLPGQLKDPPVDGGLLDKAGISETSSTLFRGQHETPSAQNLANLPPKGFADWSDLFD